MAFPFLSEENFETGTRGHFDAETDTETRLDFPHYSALSRVPGLPAPYRGAYCMRVNLANDGTPADAYVQETGSWDTAADGSAIYFRWKLFVTNNITMANTNEFAIHQLWSSTDTVEGGVYINFTTANGLRIGIGDASASSFAPLTTGVWHTVEVLYTIDNDVANDGTIDAWLDGGALTQVTGLDQAAITSGVLGVLGQDAGTTAGTVLFDQVVADDERIYPISDRWTQEIKITKDQHVFVGTGIVDNVTLVSGAATDCTLDLYDTDIGATNDASNVKLHLNNTANNEMVDPAGVPVQFTRGCFVSLGGTNPYAIVKLRSAKAWGSDGAVRSHGIKRRPHPLGA